MKIDSHQHFWRYNATEYPWIPPRGPLARDWLPADLLPLLSRCNLNASIAVQARQSLAETYWLLGLADAAPHIIGVVGWVDLQAPDLESQLATLASHPKFLGIRHVAQDEPNDQFLALPQIVRGVQSLIPFGLTYDILIYARQLPAAIELVRQCPDQIFILDHIAKPSIAAAQISPWQEQIRELAQFPNVACKVSGMITEASPDWTPESLTPYLDAVFDAFGTDRLMFGSDWPVCLLAGSYEAVHDIVMKRLERLTAEEQDKVLGGNALKWYLKK
jgi:L-fuconolactonase